MHDLRDLLNKFKQSDSLSDLEEYNSGKALKERLDELNLDDREAVSNDLRSRIGQERLIGKNNLMDVSFLSKGMQLSQSVCRIIQLRGQDASPVHTKAVGSGFLVGENVLMTNHHVINTRFWANQYMAQFNYEYGPTGKLRETYSFKFDPDSFFVTNEQLDYTLVGVSPLAFNHQGKNISDFGYLELTSTQGKFLIGEPLCIIQHPEGLPKMIAIRDSQVLQVEAPYIHYTTDTQKGSSGSMVANDQWEVVALHHCAVAAKNEEGDYLTKKGDIWREGMDDNLIDWIANEGVLMDFILEDLKSRSFSEEQEKIKDHILRKYTPKEKEDEFKLPV